MSRRFDWSVRAAESCGWLLDVDADLVQAFLVGRGKQPSTTLNKRERDVEEAEVQEAAILAIENAIALNSAPESAWSIDALPMFWKSAASLETEDIPTFEALIDRLVEAPGNFLHSDNIGMIKAPPAYIEGRRVPEIWLFYVLDEDTETIFLNYIERFAPTLDHGKPARGISEIA